MSRPNSVPLQIYRRLLALYPRDFRARYADEMARLFADQLRDAAASGRPAAEVRTWLRALADLAVTATAERGARFRVRSASAVASAPDPLLGLLGLAAGLTLLVGMVTHMPGNSSYLINVGAIAVVVGVSRRRVGSPGQVILAASTAAILINAAYLVIRVTPIMDLLPLPSVVPSDYPAFRLIAFVFGPVLWLCDGLFAAVAWRTGAARRRGALTLAMGCLLAFVGTLLEFVKVQSFGPVGQAIYWLLGPSMLLAYSLVGLGWLLMGLDVIDHRRNAGARPTSPAPDLTH
jgi:hypothetical protein